MTTADADQTLDLAQAQHLRRMLADFNDAVVKAKEVGLCVMFEIPPKEGNVMDAKYVLLMPEQLARMNVRVSRSY
jgi:hypothetical protein